MVEVAAPENKRPGALTVERESQMVRQTRIPGKAPGEICRRKKVREKLKELRETKEVVSFAERHGLGTKLSRLGHSARS